MPSMVVEQLLVSDTVLTKGHGEDKTVRSLWTEPSAGVRPEPVSRESPSVTRAPQTARWARSRGCEQQVRQVPRMARAGAQPGATDGAEPENPKASRKGRAESSSSARRAGLAERRARSGWRRMPRDAHEMWRWLKIWKLRTLLQKAEASPKTYSTKLGKSDTVRCRGWWFLLSRRWQPSGKKYHVTQVQEPGKGMMAAHPGWRERPPAGGPEATSWGRTADVRAAPPEGSEGRAHRDTSALQLQRGRPAWRAGLAGAARQGGGSCGRGSTAQATGREEPRAPTAPGSVLGQTPCDGQKGSRATRDQSRQRGPGNSSRRGRGGGTPGKTAMEGDACRRTFETLLFTFTC